MRDSDYLEYLVLQQLSGGGAGASVVWLQVALLVCLFLVAVLRPSVIRAKALFRLAGVLFALSLLVSPTLNLLLGYLYRLGGGGSSFGRSSEMTILFSFPAVISAVLFGLSLICGLCSLGLGSAGAASAAAIKPPQTMAELANRPDPRDAGWDEIPKPRSGPPSSGPPSSPHPLDEPD
jgi:hypothetical protein